MRIISICPVTPFLVSPSKDDYSRCRESQQKVARENAEWNRLWRVPKKEEVKRTGKVKFTVPASLPIFSTKENVQDSSFLSHES